jgi:hypothetical protein
VSYILPDMTISVIDDYSVPLRGRKWDWNLTLLALSYGFTVSIMVRELLLLFISNLKTNKGIILI